MHGPAQICVDLPDQAAGAHVLAMLELAVMRTRMVAAIAGTLLVIGAEAGAQALSDRAGASKRPLSPGDPPALHAVGSCSRRCRHHERRDELRPESPAPGQAIIS